ncbi:MAG: glycine cleavage system protein H [Desulfobacterota bacterium]|nr:glycine cleavage system protein H [Thermodesulfobacteriota bacterium]MDW8001270.1 glycine cleavage system protein H [Deltaproteobacteria bacterium]
MEGFTYIDIFATKGIEYILVILFLAAFVVFSYMTLRPRRASTGPSQSPRTIMSRLFRIPDYLYYHQGHTWVFPEGERIARVGIDDFAQKLVGNVEAIKVPKRGEEIIQGEVGWSLFVDGKEIKMLSPLDGEIIEINEKVIKNPKKLSEDPYGDGWLLKVYSPNLKSNLKNLLNGRLAIRWVDALKESLFSRMNYNLGYLLQDGGLPISGMAKSLNPESWDEMVKEYFMTKDV